MRSGAPTPFLLPSRRYESFSFNDTSGIGTGGGNPLATTANFSAFSTSALLNPTVGILYPYATVPAVSDDSVRSLWRVDLSAGLLYATTDDPCARSAPSILALVGANFFNNNFATRVTISTPQRVIATVRLDSDGSAAGVVLRLASATGYYRFVLYGASATIPSSPVPVLQGFAIERATGAARNQFVSLTRQTFAPVSGVWYTVDATVTGSTLTASVYLGAPTFGGGVGTGIYANTTTPVASLTTTNSNFGEAAAPVSAPRPAFLPPHRPPPPLSPLLLQALAASACTPTAGRRSTRSSSARPATSATPARTCTTARTAPTPASRASTT